MGLAISTNLEAIRVHDNLVTSNNNVAKSLRRLSSGLRINSAKDDASGFAIANSFKAKASAMRVSSQNASEGQSMLQVADGAYSKIDDILVRMKSLATQAASGQTENLTTMNNEFLALQKEIDHIANSTKYGGTALIDGSSSGSGSVYTGTQALQNLYNFVGTLNVDTKSDAGSASTALGMYDTTGLTMAEGNIFANLHVIAEFIAVNGVAPAQTTAWNSNVSQLTAMYNSYLEPGSSSGGGLVTFQVGATNTATDRLTISFDGATSDSLKVSSSAIGIASQESAREAMSALDLALTSINAFMGNIGAYQNRLQYAIENLAIGTENFMSSASAIEDADMASEMSELSKNQILQQSGMAMLSQANQSPQQILSLLR